MVVLCLGVPVWVTHKVPVGVGMCRSESLLFRKSLSDCCLRESVRADE